MADTRRFLSKEIPACWSVRPPSAFRQPLQSSLCAGWRAWKANEPPAHSGISFSGKRLMLDSIAEGVRWEKELGTGWKSGY